MKGYSPVSAASAVAMAIRWRGFVLAALISGLTGSISHLAGAETKASAELLRSETSTFHPREEVDRIAKFQRDLTEDRAHLAFDPQFGYLLSVLEKLNISPASQLLVFSKTSFQQDRISPQTPRAIYFNDSAYVAWIPGSPLLEVSGADPKAGAVFYTLRQDQSRAPRFVRREQCLDCHTSSKTIGVSGYVVRSCVTDEAGRIDLDRESFQVTHRTPVHERWAGWYVTGEHGSQRHLGNLVGPSDFERHRRDSNFRNDLLKLDPLIDVAKYPRPTSDIGALLVFDHQVHMQNLITRLSQESRQSFNETGSIDRAKGAANAFLKYALFVDEPKLASPIKGNRDFTEWFERQGPKDRNGRSLRQLDLQTRLFKYPCSYLLYSEAFDQIPRDMKLYVYRRLWKILRNEDPSPEFQGLSTEAKRDVLQILTETKRGLPAYWTLVD